jgi:hypothetical protein
MSEELLALQKQVRQLKALVLSLLVLLLVGIAAGASLAVDGVLVATELRLKTANGQVSLTPTQLENLLRLEPALTAMVVLDKNTNRVQELTIDRGNTKTSIQPGVIAMTSDEVDRTNPKAVNPIALPKRNGVAALALYPELQPDNVTANGNLYVAGGARQHSFEHQEDATLAFHGAKGKGFTFYQKVTMEGDTDVIGDINIVRNGKKHINIGGLYNNKPGRFRRGICLHDGDIEFKDERGDISKHITP